MEKHHIDYALERLKEIFSEKVQKLPLDRYSSYGKAPEKVPLDRLQRAYNRCRDLIGCGAAINGSRGVTIIERFVEFDPTAPETKETK